VIGFGELLQQTGANERQLRFVERMIDGATRCQKIVQNLLSFARQHTPERKPVVLQELVEAAANHFVFMTGDVINESTRAFLEEHDCVCLSKPFSLEELRHIVQEVSHSSAP